MADDVVQFPREFRALVLQLRRRAGGEAFLAGAQVSGPGVGDTRDEDGGDAEEQHPVGARHRAVGQVRCSEDRWIHQ
ncbi:hypothetical protein [Corynebacterium bovis]|uniref:hypothetical protein n=1 Tax=Corynebacterium bovis TaxID=36808 RepID=UPI001E3358F1|nr:hypothetical protein [Corynebacterium bovis]